jgi:hypothetical protein
MKGKALSLILGAAVCATPALADGNHGINWTQKREQARIHQGIRSGELTRNEARRLEAEQARIRVDERFSRADGKFTAKERERLRKELHHASHDIYRQKHDHQDRN